MVNLDREEHVPHRAPLSCCRKQARRIVFFCIDSGKALPETPLVLILFLNFVLLWHK